VGNRVGKIGAAKNVGLTRLHNDRRAARTYSEHMPCAPHEEDRDLIINALHNPAHILAELQP
jgi:hypothetical protein